jgi:hypothetical protein
MMRRPALAAKVRLSTPQEWFGCSLREVRDADFSRWLAAKRAAENLLR